MATIERQTTFAAALAAALGLAGGAAAQPTQTEGPNAPRAQQVNPSPMPEGSRAAQGTGAPNNVPGLGAQQVNPSPMVPGSRAGDAPGMGGARQAIDPGAQGAPHAAPRATGQGEGQAAGQGAVPGAVPGQGVQRNLSVTGTPSGSPVGTPRQMGPGEATSAATQDGTGPTTAQGATNPDRGIPGGTGVNAPSAQPDVGRGTAQVQPSAPNPAPGGAATGATSPGRMEEGGGRADQTPPAATTRDTEPRTAAAPVPGANSFTEGQARARMADAGFNDVQELRLDEQGIWRGRAMREGQPTGVALDFQGNVVPTP